jgi:hypothetical protein
MLVTTVAALSLAIGAVAGEPLPHRPAIAFAGAAPSDLRALATSTWQRFVAAFPARAGCLRDVTVAGAWKFSTRARYAPGRRLVTIRIPGTAPNLLATLVHEFAHHVEFTCPAQRELRPRFLEAQRLPARTPWFGGDTWTEIPSEQFAEATVQVVLGRSPHPLVLVRPRALEVIREWATRR